jgi:hypothetical protein
MHSARGGSRGGSARQGPESFEPAINEVAQPAAGEPRVLGGQLGAPEIFDQQLEDTDQGPSHDLGLGFSLALVDEHVG